MQAEIQKILDRLSAARRNRIEAAFWRRYVNQGEQEPVAARIIAEFVRDTVKQAEREQSEQAARTQFEETFTEP